MVAQTLTNPFLDLVAGCGLVDLPARDNECRYGLAVSLVWDAYDRGI